MLRKCNGSDPNLRDASGQVGHCGVTFDDVTAVTICPHLEFAVTKAAVADWLFGGGPTPPAIQLAGASDPYGAVPATDYIMPLGLAGDYHFATTTAGVSVMVCRQTSGRNAPSGCQGWTDASDLRQVLLWIEQHEHAEHNPGRMYAAPPTEPAPEFEYEPITGQHHHHPLQSGICRTEHGTPPSEQHLYGVGRMDARTGQLLVDHAADLAEATSMATLAEGVVVAWPIVADYRPRPVDTMGEWDEMAPVFRDVPRQRQPEPEPAPDDDQPAPAAPADAEPAAPATELEKIMAIVTDGELVARGVATVPNVLPLRQPEQPSLIQQDVEDAGRLVGVQLLVTDDPSIVPPDMERFTTYTGNPVIDNALSERVSRLQPGQDLYVQRDRGQDTYVQLANAA